MKDARQSSAFRTKSHSLRHERAISLYDVLVTMTVVGVVSTMAVPYFQQLTASQRISGAVNALITALHLARSEAITRVERTTLCPSTDGHACRNGDANGTVWDEGYLLYYDHNGNHEVDAGEMAVRMFDAIEGVHIRTSAHRDHVTYQPNGLASGANLTFTLCDKHGRGTPRAVIVSNGGRPRASSRDANGGIISCPTGP